MSSPQAVPLAAKIKGRKGKRAPTAEERPPGLAQWEWNLETKEYSWSEGMYHIFNLSPQPFPPRTGNFLNRVHPDDRQRVVKALGEALVGSRPYNLEHRILCADGSVRFVHGEAQVWFNNGSKPIRMMGTLRDVTALRPDKVAAET